MSAFTLFCSGFDEHEIDSYVYESTTKNTWDRSSSISSMRAYVNGYEMRRFDNRSQGVISAGTV